MGLKLNYLLFYFNIFKFFAKKNLKINCDEFVPMFEKQNPDFKWNDVQVADILVIVFFKF